VTNIVRNFLGTNKQGPSPAVLDAHPCDLAAARPAAFGSPLLDRRLSNKATAAACAQYTTHLASGSVDRANKIKGNGTHLHSF